MKTTVITTVAQHYKGVNLHLKNLRWAFGDDANIIVQHFNCHEMPKFDVVYKGVDANPCNFYFFWDNSKEILSNDSDFFVFTEQDILITKKPEFSKSGCIKLSFLSDYLSIFDLNYQKLYPRIWEGYTFVPGWLVRKAIDNNVNFGNHISQSINWNLNNLYTKYGRWILLNDYLKTEGRSLHEGHFDTMFEFSLFCFLNNIKYVDNCVDGYHISSDAVHFRGIDRLCFDCQIYDNLNYILNPSPSKPNLNNVYKEMINDCAAMLLLSGAHDKSKAMQNFICYKLNKKRLFLKLKQLEIHAKEWMTPFEIESLKWALSILDNKKLYI